MAKTRDQIPYTQDEFDASSERYRTEALQRSAMSGPLGQGYYQEHAGPAHANEVAREKADAAELRELRGGEPDQADRPKATGAPY